MGDKTKTLVWKRGDKKYETISNHLGERGQNGCKIEPNKCEDGRYR